MASKELEKAKREALEIENKKLKQQLMCMKLELAASRFVMLPEEEKSAVELCYNYI